MTVTVLDACVLYPPAVRDVLLCLAEDMLYAPRWTARIHQQWMEAVLVRRPDLTRGQLERTRQLMDQIDPESLVTGYEPHIAAV